MRLQAIRTVVPCVVAALALCAAPLPAQQIAPPGTGGIGALERILDRLTRNGRVLVIGAHPDDEDTELLAYLSRGLGLDAAYLSLSRGEGGQNLIGSELGESLGIRLTSTSADLLRRFGLPDDATGALIAEVAPGSVAAKAGLRPGDLISEVALAIEMGADGVDIGRTIHPHPTLSESVGLSAEVFEGVCTDLPPPRKK